MLYNGFSKDLREQFRKRAETHEEKRFSILLILLLLFITTASASQPSVTTAPVPVNREETEGRIYADEMEERYHVKILFGEECENTIHTDSYEITIGDPVGSPFQMMIGYNITDVLKYLEKALLPYPISLFTCIRDENSPNGIRILLVDQIIPKNMDMIVAGFTSYEDGYYNLVLSQNIFSKSTFHHELWHAMEMIITAKNPDAFQSWYSLNPPDFQYAQDYNIHVEDYNTDYFVGEYGTINAWEDRATIAEAAFYSNRSEWFAEHPAIKKKLDAMNEALKDTLSFQYSITPDS